MTAIQPKNEVSNQGVGKNSAQPGAPSGASTWKRFTAACERLAESFLSDSAPVCGQFPCGPQTASTNSDQSSEKAKMLVDDKVTKRPRQRRMTTALLRKAGPEFKNSLLTLHKNLQKVLPTITEKNEYAEVAPKHAEGKSDLAAQFAAMGDFDFDSEPNPFREFYQSRQSNDASVSDISVQAQKTVFSQRIVDRVPSDFTVTRDQMLTNLRGKIIAANFKATNRLNIHNEAALNKLLGTLGRAVSESNIASLDALTPSEANTIFERFCQEMKVSPFRKGY